MEVKKSVLKSGMLEGVYAKAYGELGMCFSAVEVVGSKSHYIHTHPFECDLHLRLYHDYLKFKTGQDHVAVAFKTNEHGDTILEAEDLNNQQFCKLIGIADSDEFNQLKRSLTNHLKYMFQALDKPRYNFRVMTRKKGGQITRVIFRPRHESLAKHLTCVEILLDLSNFIDLTNKPKKGKKLQEAQAKFIQQAIQQGMSEAEAKQAAKNIEVIDPVYDIMLALHYYNEDGEEDKIALGMYTQANGVTKFSNGTDVNDYQTDFARLGIRTQEIRVFKQSLIDETLNVLTALKIERLDNSIQGLGLEEPWPEGVTREQDIEITEENIQLLRKRIMKNVAERAKRAQTKGYDYSPISEEEMFSASGM